MNVAVLVKLALDTGQLRLSQSAVGVEETPLKISDIDRNAVEEAVKLRGNAGKAVSISVLKWPPVGRRTQEAENLLREVLAMGVDEAYLVADEALAGSDHYMTAKAIAEVVRRIGADIVVAGEATVDGYTAQIPARVAAELGWPYLTYVRELRVEGGRAVARRDLEDRVLVVEADLPLVVSVTREINVPRIPTLLAIRAAMKKPIARLGLGDLGIGEAPRARLAELRPLMVSRRRLIVKEGTVEEKVDRFIDFLMEEGILRGT